MSLYSDLKKYRAQKSYLWRAVIDPIVPGESNPIDTATLTSKDFGEIQDRALGFLKAETLSKVKGDAIQFPDLAIVSVSMPTQDFGLEATPAKGSQIKKPTLYSINEVVVTFLETENGTVFDTLTKWRERVYNTTTNTFGLASEYTTDMRVELLTSKRLAHTAINLRKIWPTTDSPLDLNYQSSDFLMISQSFAVTKVELDPQLLGAIAGLQQSDIDLTQLQNIRDNFPFN